MDDHRFFVRVVVEDDDLQQATGPIGANDEGPPGTADLVLVFVGDAVLASAVRDRLDVRNIAWGHDMGDEYAHVTTNCSPFVDGRLLHERRAFGIGYGRRWLQRGVGLSKLNEDPVGDIATRDGLEED